MILFVIMLGSLSGVGSTCFNLGKNRFSYIWHLQCLVDGADEYLQLLDVASNTMRAICDMMQEY